MEENLTNAIENAAEKTVETIIPASVASGSFTAKDVVIGSFAGAAVGAAATQVPKLVRFVSGKIRERFPKKEKEEKTDTAEESKEKEGKTDSKKK